MFSGARHLWQPHFSPSHQEEGQGDPQSMTLGPLGLRLRSAGQQWELHPGVGEKRGTEPPAPP